MMVLTNKNVKSARNKELNKRNVYMIKLRCVMAILKIESFCLITQDISWSSSSDSLLKFMREVNLTRKRIKFTGK